MNDVHARPVEPCPFYGTPCEYVAVANASAARIKALEEALQDIVDADQDEISDRAARALLKEADHD